MNLTSELIDVAPGGDVPPPRLANPRFWRGFLAFFGPGYLVATGYMDPGNWATAIAGGSAFGYKLLFVVMFANLMAIVLQALAARLGLATNLDLAQTCRLALPRPVSVVLWFTAELAICATDLAEVIGTAIGLNLLFGLPILAGCLITAADVLLVLAMQRLGFRWIEAFVMTMLLLIAGCFVAQMVLAHPDWRQVGAGLLPTSDILSQPGMLYIAIGMVGATVMPHNLYLHSGIVQTTRQIGPGWEARRTALRLAVLDAAIALMMAVLINLALIVMAAAAFHASGHLDVTDLSDAYRLISPLLGAPLAATLFAVALLACGLNSTITATLAGQMVMEGFLQIRLPAWARRLLTRLLAIIPAVAAVLILGEAAIGKLLILSQVVLSLQLPFAMIPLIAFTAQGGRMGVLVAPRWLTAIASVIAVLIIGLNFYLIVQLLAG